MNRAATGLKRHQRLIDEAVRADDAMRRSGRGYEARDVHAYLEAKAKKRPARRPRAVRWRR